MGGWYEIVSYCNEFPECWSPNCHTYTLYISWNIYVYKYFLFKDTKKCSIQISVPLGVYFYHGFRRLFLSGNFFYWVMLPCLFTTCTFTLLCSCWAIYITICTCSSRPNTFFFCLLRHVGSLWRYIGSTITLFHVRLDFSTVWVYSRPVRYVLVKIYRI